MSTLVAKEQRVPVLSDNPTSSATHPFGPTTTNSFGKIGQPSRVEILEGSHTREPKEWIKVEKRKEKKKRKEEQKAIVSFDHGDHGSLHLTPVLAYSYSPQVLHSTWRI